MKGFNDSVKVATPKKQPKDLSHEIYTTMDFYQFRPVFIKQMYPDDSYEVSVSDYFRARPLAGAPFGNMVKKYAAFFVPNRILWDKWTDFLNGGSSGRLTFSFPRINPNAFAAKAFETFGLIQDYEQDDDHQDLWLHYQAIYRNALDFWTDLGFPVKELWERTSATGEDEVREFENGEFDFPLLEAAACQRIWFDWFRDQNLIGDDLEDLYCPKNISGLANWEGLLHTSFIDGNNPKVGDMFLNPKPVALEKDYFTTAFVEPQRGGAAFIPVQLPSSDLNPGFSWSSSSTSTNSDLVLLRNNVNSQDSRVSHTQSPTYNSATDIIGMLEYTSIRTGKALQKYLELNNVAGSSDLYQHLAHWGVTPNPLVYNRSVFLGSFTDKMSFSEVVSPSDTSGSSAGEVACRLNGNAHGKFSYHTKEHGFFIIVCIVRPENVYSEGVARERRKGCLGNGRFDFFTKEFEKTGMQPQYLYEYTDAILLKRNQEEYDMASGRGFVPRYAEDKRMYNRYTGQMQTRDYDTQRITMDYGVYAALSDENAAISLGNTMVYGYPYHFQYDCIFKTIMPMYDHLEGWIRFDFNLYSERAGYAAPLIEEIGGDDVNLPYAGVRM